MRLRVELTERPDVAAGRGVAAGVVQIDIEAGRSRRAPEGVADLAREHRRAYRVRAHLTELQRRVGFQIHGGLWTRGTPDAHPDCVPHLASGSPVPGDGSGVAPLANPIDVHSSDASSRLQRGVQAKQGRRRVAPVGMIEAHHDGPCPERRDTAAAAAVTGGHALETAFGVGPIERAHQAVSSVRHLQAAAAEGEDAAILAARPREHLSVELVHVDFIHVRGAPTPGEVASGREAALPLGKQAEVGTGVEIGRHERPREREHVAGLEGGRHRRQRAKVEIRPTLDALAQLTAKPHPHGAVAAEVDVPDRREGIRTVRRCGWRLGMCGSGDGKRADRQHVAHGVGSHIGRR